MKHTLTLITALLLTPLALLHDAEQPAQPASSSRCLKTIGILKKNLAFKNRKIVMNNYFINNLVKLDINEKTKTCI